MFHQRRGMVEGVVALLVMSGALSGAAEEGPAQTAAAQEGARIAAISGVHEPHQGFALSANVPSDRMCLELAQNLASELGIVVHLVCTDPRNGRTTVVAECGYASDPKASKVEVYSRGWRHSEDPFLICVRPDRERFRARRLAPEVETLRPTADR